MFFVILWMICKYIMTNYNILLYYIKMPQKQQNNFLIPYSIILMTLLIINSQASRANLTDFYASLLQLKSMPYQCHAGYEDIDWFAPGQKASVFYSAWESSTRKFTDHSTPVIFYLNGGPGLSSQFAAMRQFGPIQIINQKGQYKGIENPWSWNYYAHLVFVDMPVGTGFSYNKLKPVTDTKTLARHFINFLAKFFKNFPFGLGNNPVYIAGQGFSAQYISAINQLLPTYTNVSAKVQGYILGGPMIYPQKQINFYQSFLSAAGIVEPKIRNLTNSWSTQAILKIRNGQHYEAKAVIDRMLTEAPKKYYNGMNINNFKRYVDSTEGNAYVGFLNKNKQQFGVPDDVVFTQFSSVVANAMAADSYKPHQKSFQTILSSGKRVLVYTGQNDFIANSASVLTFLQDAEWKGARDWKQSKKFIWKEGGKIAGWVKKSNNFIYVIIKGAGHYIYEDEPVSDKSMYLMLNNFFNKKW